MAEQMKIETIPLLVLFHRCFVIEKDFFPVRNIKDEDKTMSGNFIYHAPTIKQQQT